MNPTASRLAGLAAALLVASAAPAAPERPNIVIILADDLGYGDLACYGHPKFKTPRLDRMAAEGARLTQFNCPAPFCAPTRASLLTGRYPFRCGMTQNPTPDAGPEADSLAMPASEVTLAQVLRAAGYATGMVGKWHLGHKPGSLPTERGFDEYLGIPYSNDMRPVHLLDGTRVVENPAVQATLTRRYTDRAVAFIRRNKDRPFLLYFAHAMPHKPLAVSPAFEGKSGAGLYGDAVAEVDASVGEVLDTLKAAGVEDRTLVVFTSDNGPWYGGSAGGLRGMKATSWEGGYRVPMIARWPGRVPAGRTSAQLTVMMDVFATALAAAGAAMPDDRVLDGRNLLPLLAGDERPVHDVIFGHQGSKLVTVRDARWKLHVKPSRQMDPKLEPDGRWIDPRGPDGTTVLAPANQYGPDAYPGLKTGVAPRAMQLFDLDADPGEQKDAAAGHPSEVKRLQAAFDAMNRDVPVVEEAKRTPLRPNILLIITDDQGYGDFSIHGNPHVRTPHIDALATSGVRFDRFYVNSFCAPTRAALLTGRWPVRTGVHGVTHNREAMRPDEVTLAEALRGGGYRTACIGKWHNGEQYPYNPTGQGFDEFFGLTAGHWNHYFDAELLRGTKPEATKGYITDVLTDEAMRFIEKGGAQPFFCYVAYNAPHSPFQVPDRHFDKFKKAGFEDNVAAFWGMCENIDDNVGRLLAKLVELKMAHNTLVVFLTDNGGTAGVKIYNAGMRGGKTSVHEGGTRVPLFMRWAAAGWTPHTVAPIVSHIDLYPTLLDLCSVPAPPGPKVDGVSLRPLLEGREASWPARTLFTHNPIDETNRYPGAVRTQRYRLVREIKGRSGGSAAKANDGSAGDWQLYDMLADPGQSNNIAAGEPALVADLSAKYEAWIDDIFRDGLRRPPIPVGHAEHNPVDLHAPQSYPTAPLSFACGPGFAHDWLTNWTNTSGRIRFEIDAARAGEYAVELAFACPAADAGSRIRVSAGEAAVEAVVPAAPAPDLPLPHRDAEGHAKYRNREWGVLKAGTLHLPAGLSAITIEALAQPGGRVMDFKHLRLTHNGGDPR
ncbi:MAG: hypothetical protein FJ221_15475 [Lentisphaerae bacterium]|nr:hypothetical protein [Lentisphaerota bacterium]